MNPLYRAWAIVAVLFVVAVSFTARAQAGIVSPGDLATPHAGLEGVPNCKKCHGREENKFRTQCLDCHRDLRERIEANKGYHAKPVVQDKKDCALCHLDHNGRDFELIRWTQSGGSRDQFDHAQTGYKLDGAHKKLACADCHHQKFQAPAGGWKNRDALDPKKTMLGLPTKCEGCHTDVHRKQFADRSCTACHNTERWTTASRNFDHAKTKYPLQGLHLDVSCKSCHKKASMDGTDVVIYAPQGGLKFGQCVDCHSNPHRPENRWEKCEDCHDVTRKFSETKISATRHAETGYALDGRHINSGCDSCHGGAGGYKSRIRELPKGDCTPCHSANTHETPAVRSLRPPYANLSDASRCSSCHTTEGFSPANYTLEAHAQTVFPVRDLHAATACLECHRPGPSLVGASHAQQPTPLVKAKRRIPLHPTEGNTKDCETCHKNVHLGEFDVNQNPDKCAGCHTTRGWQDVTFDHAKTGFRREGKHATAQCSDCHERNAKPLAARRIRATVGLPATTTQSVEVRKCQACHFDPHFAQFEQGSAMDSRAPARECQNCHGTETFETPDFDHARMGRWELGLAHQKTPCTQCHTPFFSAAASPASVTPGVRRSLRYRGVPRECSACHSNPHKFGPGSAAEKP